MTTDLGWEADVSSDARSERTGAEYTAPARRSTAYVETQCLAKGHLPVYVASAITEQSCNGLPGIYTEKYPVPVQLSFRNGWHTLLERIWLTYLRSANDPREIRYGYAKALAALDRVIFRDYKGERQELLRQFRELTSKYHVNSKMFCACFSLVADTLPMWLAYGDAYRGVCIGFDSAAFNDMHARVQKVTYLDEDKPVDFDLIARKICKKVIRHYHRDQITALVQGGDLFNSTVTGLKHTSWKHEDEVRVVYAYSRMENREIPGLLRHFVGERKDGVLIPRVDPNVRRRGDEEVEYFSELFGKYEHSGFDFRSAITEIIIGPQSTIVEQDVRDMLAQNGFEGVTVKQSQCLIRV